MHPHAGEPAPGSGAAHVISLLELDFMQRALLAGLLTGLAAPGVGIYMVQRRLALLGDGIGHVALTGVAVGFLPSTAPVLTAIAGPIAGAVAIELVRARGRTSGDMALAMLFYGGIAGGVLLIGLAGGSDATLNTYLFGSLTSVSSSDLCVVVAARRSWCSAGASDWAAAVRGLPGRGVAKVSGLPVRLLNILIAVIAAVTVTVAMRAVGLLLVSALMVVPVATASSSPGRSAATFLTACGWESPAAAGMVSSYNADVAPGATSWCWRWRGSGRGGSPGPPGCGAARARSPSRSRTEDDDRSRCDKHNSPARSTS